MSRRVLIADDEPIARERVRMMLAGLAGYQIVAEAGDGPEAVDLILRHTPDIVFLDIRMPGLDGFELLQALEESRIPPAIIFVTAYDRFALQAFDVGAVDYLLKPFDPERFAEALSRAEARLHAGAAADPEIKALLKRLVAQRAHPDRFLVRAAKHLYFVSAADIEWVDTASNYVRLHIGGRTHLVRDTLTAFAAKLSPDRFVRVHRSAIVSLDHIRQLEPHGHGEYRIILKDGTRLTSSRSFSTALQARLR